MWLRIHPPLGWLSRTKLSLVESDCIRFVDWNSNLRRRRKTFRLILKIDKFKYQDAIYDNISVNLIYNFKIASFFFLLLDFIKLSLFYKYKKRFLLFFSIAITFLYKVAWLLFTCLNSWLKPKLKYCYFQKYHRRRRK